MTATIEINHNASLENAPRLEDTPAGTLRWRRDGETTYYEGRLIEKTDGSLAFITSYADRPDRTDLIQIEYVADPTASEKQRLLVRCVEGHDDMHCLVACSDA